MEYFPRVGIELSTEAVLRFSKPKNIRPAFVRRFENGSREGRFRTAARTLDFLVSFTGPEGDVAVMDEFFNTHGVVVPFTIVHPRLGIGNAFLKLIEHEFQDVVRGTPWWSSVEIPIEGAF